MGTDNEGETKSNGLQDAEISPLSPGLKIRVTSCPGYTIHLAILPFSSTTELPFSMKNSEDNIR